MSIYPSCLFNRINEARRHFPSVEIDNWNSVIYPYNLIDLAVRLRPIVNVINTTKGIDAKVALQHFEPSWWFDGKNRYVGAREVPVAILLGAIIHESYVHVGPTQDSGKRSRLDIMSDKGRWIVYFDEFIDAMRAYLLNTDQIAETVCDMIDNHQRSIAKDPELCAKAPPKIGNWDIDWLLWEYVLENSPLKQAILSDVFGLEAVPRNKLMQVRFSANSVGHQTFDLHFSPAEWNLDIENKRRVRWLEFSELVRAHVPNS